MITFAIWLATTTPALDRSAIILGGGATAAEGEGVAAAFASAQEKAAIKLAPRPEFPKIVKSDTIAGLKPGFVIALLGFCDDPARAKNIAAFANQSLKGVYVRAVGGELPKDSCPEIVAPHPKPPRRHRLIDELYTSPPGLARVAIYEEQLACRGQSATPVQLVIRLERGTHVLADQAFEAQCPSRNIPEPSLIRTSSQIASVGKKTFVLVEVSSFAVDTETVSCTVIEATASDLVVRENARDAHCDAESLATSAPP